MRTAGGDSLVPQQLLIWRADVFKINWNGIQIHLVFIPRLGPYIQFPCRNISNHPMQMGSS